MSVITLDATLAAAVLEMDWGQLRNDLVSSGLFGSQAAMVSEPWWTIAITSNQMNDSQADLWYGTLMSLRGRENQLAAWNLGRPQPLGTMRGSPTLSADVAAGSYSLPVHVGTAGWTLRVGDFLGMGSGLTQQVVMVVSPVTFDGSGNATVTIEPATRNDFSNGDALVWDKPKALFRRTDDATSWKYSTIIVEGFTLNMREDPRT